MSTKQTTTQERSVNTLRIDSRDPDGWTLMIHHGDVMAVKQIPYSGQRYFSTESRPNRADKTSAFGRDVDEVVAFYVREAYDADPVVFATLLKRVQREVAV